MADVKEPFIPISQIVQQVSDDLAKRFDSALAPSILKIIETGVKTLTNNLEKKSISIVNKYFGEANLKFHQAKNQLLLPQQQTALVTATTERQKDSSPSVLPSNEKQKVSLPSVPLSTSNQKDSYSLISSLIKSFNAALREKQTDKEHIKALISSLQQTTLGPVNQKEDKNKLVNSTNTTVKATPTQTFYTSIIDKISSLFSQDKLQTTAKKIEVQPLSSSVTNKNEQEINRTSPRESNTLIERLFKKLSINFHQPTSNKAKQLELPVSEKKQPSLLADEQESMKVLFDGFTDKGVMELKEKLPKILQEAFEDLFKKEPEKKDDKKNTSGLMGWLGSLLGPGVLKGAMAALAGISGLFVSLYGMFTSDWYKGLAKLIGRGLMDFSGFTKMAEGFIGRFATRLINLPKTLLSKFGASLMEVFGKTKNLTKAIGTSSIVKQIQQFAGGFVSRLIAIPKNLISSFGKSIMGVFGGGLGKSALGAGLNAAKGFIPRLLGGVLRFLKKVPFIGSIITIGYAWDRFNKGDLVGGGLEVLSGVANAFGLSPLSWAIDGLNAFLDYKAGGIGEGKKSKGSIIAGWVKSFGSWAKEKLMKMPVLGPLINATSKLFSDPLGSLKSMAFAIPGVESLVSFFESPLENSKQMIKSAGNWISKFGSWAWEKIQNIPILGSIIKGVTNIFSGNFMEGLKDLAKATPIVALVDFLASTETGQQIGEKAKGMIGSIGGFIGTIKDKILRKILEFLPETILGVSVRSRVADMLGIKMGPIQDDIAAVSMPAKASQESKPSTVSQTSSSESKKTLEQPPVSVTAEVPQPVKQAGDAVVDPKKGLIVSSPKEGAIVQLSKKDGIVAGPISEKGSKEKDTYPKQLTPAGNIEILRNKKIDEVAENTRKTYKGIEHLTQSITLLAKALEKTTGVSPTVVNNISKGGKQTSSSVTMTQIAQQGNPDIRNVRSTFSKMAY